MSTWTISALDGSQPAGYLAALGLAFALPDATIRFDETTPVLAAAADEELAVESACSALECATHPDSFPFPDQKDLRSTTPSWSTLHPFARASWTDSGVNDALRTFDVGSAKEKTGALADPQVASASLILITGRSYVRKSLNDLWPAPRRKKDAGVERERQRSALRFSIRNLLRGGTVATSTAGMALRFTASEASPRLRLGTEVATIRPSIEALAFLGATHLLPRQLGRPAVRRPNDDGRTPPLWERRGLTWSLNLVDLTPRAVATIHEERAAPAVWPRFTTVARTNGGGDRASHFTEIRPLEER